MNHESDISINRMNPQQPPLDLLSVTAHLLRNCRQLLWWAAASTVAGVLVALLWKPYYSSTAIILPPQQQQSLAASLTAQIPQLAAGSLSGMGLKSPGDMYVGIMQGRTVTDRVVDKLHLQTVFHTKMLSDARNKLMHDVSFESSRDGLIRITCKASTPQLSADIANAYVEALYNMNSHLAITEASQRRLFFQQQVDEEKAQLTNAEDSLKTLQQKTGMIQLSGQTELLLHDIATVRSQITNREVQLRSLSTFDTSENPDIQQTQQELDALRSKLSQLENTQRTSLGSLSAISSVSEVPAAGLEYLRKLRDVQYHESLFALLSKQFEAARLDEAKSAPVLQVVDHAVPPERKAGPSRVLIVLFSLIIGTIVGSLVILLRAVLPSFWRKLQLS
jgi:uncharacterized protein involved in exopolysaccharide biosynthesis